jgi:hypothetical protein
MVSRCFSFSKSDQGYLETVEQQIINKKSYLFLKRESSPVATLLLTNDHEESVQELKVKVVQQSPSNPGQIWKRRSTSKNMHLNIKKKCFYWTNIMK